MNPFKDEIHLLAEALKTVTCRGLVHGNLHKMIPKLRVILTLCNEEHGFPEVLNCSFDVAHAVISCHA